MCHIVWLLNIKWQS